MFRLFLSLAGSVHDFWRINSLKTMWTAGTKRPLFSKHSAQTKGASQLSLSPIIFSPSGLVPLVKYSKYCSSFQAGKGLFKSPSAILIAFKYLGLLRNLSHAKRLW